MSSPPRKRAAALLAARSSLRKRSLWRSPRTCSTLSLSEGYNPTMSRVVSFGLISTSCAKFSKIAALESCSACLAR